MGECGNKLKMRKILVVFLLLIGLGEATLIGEGVEVGSSGGTTYYTVNMWDVSANVSVNSTNIVLYGMDPNQDTISNTSGLWCQNSASCTLVNISGGELIWVNNWVGNTSAPEVINITGSSLTDIILRYNTSGGGNITLILDDLSDDCNYGKFAVTGNTSNLEYFYFARSLSAFTECDLVLQMNSSAQTTPSDIEIKEDESMSDTTLSTILAAMGITALVVSHGYQHKSKSTS